MGSRMLESGGALAGGMPLYKFAGNKILTFIQNRLLNADLSEYHSGYRAYSVPLLKSIPFEYNDNDFHFDTQIIIQALMVKAKILEVPIPTYYGDEICHVNGIKYAYNVLMETCKSRLQKLEILYCIEYDVDKKVEYLDKSYFQSSHSMAFAAVHENAKVFDIGCGRGHIARLLKEKGCVVSGMDNVVLEEDEKRIFKEYFQVDLDDSFNSAEIGEYDYIYFFSIS